jgi:site-specific recombinase XerD
VGSNPTQSIESSVQIPDGEKILNEYTTVYLSPSNGITISDNNLRDLYNRAKRLESWIDKVNTELQEPDRSDVLKLVEHLRDTEKSALWIIRYLTAILMLRKKITKPFRYCSKSEIKELLEWMKAKKYKRSTHEKFRVILKSFYKIVYGNNEYYPDTVKWFSVKVNKEICDSQKTLDTAEYLEEEEIARLVEYAPSIQKKAFIGCMYESGARPEEFLRLTNTDLTIDTKGAIFILRGKTGERRVRIISFTSLLKQWLEIHPLKKNDRFPMWISEATLYNLVKALKLFGEMSDVPISWKKITRGLPKVRSFADDRAPTIDEIRKMMEYPDRRMKAIICTMDSSGIRLGAWDYLHWEDVEPIMKDGCQNLLSFGVNLFFNIFKSNNLTFQSLKQISVKFHTVPTQPDIKLVLIEWV